MNPRTHAIRVGAHRGWTEFLLIRRNPSDLAFYVLMPVTLLGTLWLNADEPVPGTSLTLATVAMPGVIGGLVVFLTMIGVALSLATEREDGTLLRVKAVPHGMVGYLSGQLSRVSLETLVGMVLVLVPGLFLFDNLAANGVFTWLGLLWVAVLGMAAVLPFGAIIGSVVRGQRGVTTWGMLPFLALVAISGIYYPIAALPEWVQILAQVFPVYWLGLGMRAAFLPDSAVAAEIGESWRYLETVAVLGGWAVLGLLLAPVVLRQMARKQSGSAMEESRQQAMQRIG